MQWIAYLKTRPFCFAKCQSISALKLSYHEHRKKSIDNFTQITSTIFSTKKAANTIRNVPPQQGMHSYAKVVDKSAGIYSNHLYPLNFIIANQRYQVLINFFRR